MPKVGLSLSGGGARGVAHIGVIQAFRDHGIPVHCVAGSSSGSIVAAMLAAGIGTDRMLEFVRETSLLRIFEIGLPTTGLTKLNFVRKQLAKYISKNNFEHLQMPLYVAVSNLNTGECEKLSRGKLFDAVMASCSIPLFFKPVVINGQSYVDGGLLDNLPIGPLVTSEQVDLLIGVHLMPNVRVGNQSFNSVIGVGMRSFELTVWNNAQSSIAQCDFCIEPKELAHHTIFNFSKVDELYNLGYEAALQSIEAIKQALFGKKEKK